MYDPGFPNPTPPSDDDFPWLGGVLGGFVGYVIGSFIDGTFRTEDFYLGGIVFGFIIGGVAHIGIRTHRKEAAEARKEEAKKSEDQASTRS